MLTVIVLALIFAVLFYWGSDNGFVAFLGAVVGACLGLMLAFAIGSTFPTVVSDTTEMSAQALTITAGDEGTYYLESDEANGVYIYQVDGIIKTVAMSKVTIEYVTKAEPVVQFNKVSLDIEKTGNLIVFGFSDGLPRDEVTFFIPQGSVYVIKQ
jgi:hypothetical protein